MTFKRALLTSMLVAVPLLAPRLAAAQPVTGVYIGAGAGLNLLNEPQHVDIRNGLGTTSGRSNAGKITSDPGYAAVLSLGYGFGNGWRTEIEGNFRENEINKIHNFGIAPIGRVGGFQRSYGAMANVFYDFDFANFGLGTSRFQPYVGIGAGYLWTESRNIRGVGLASNTTVFSDDTAGRFAYQGIVGVATPLTWLGVTGLSLTAEYRFMGSLEPRLTAAAINNNTGVVTRGKIEPENYHHSVMLGLRYAFNQPPAAVAVAAPAAPVAARTYLVFFDWDRYDLTARAREIITEAAQNARRSQTTRIDVAGHADRSGSPQYNQQLSQRRADAVAAELVRQGIGRNEISISAYGESRPLVPTADGVREPQNRRVEIVLR